MHWKILAVLTVIALFAGSASFAADTGAIKVGAILAVTGPAANLGSPEARTLQMMVEEINAAGGLLGRKVQLILKDSQGSADKAFSFAKQLIDEEEVLAVIGPSTSGESMKIKDLCNDGETILLSCAAAETIVNPVARWVFKTPQMDAFAAQMIFTDMKAKGISRIGALVSNTSFGQGGKAQIEKLAPAAGISVASVEVYDSNATDLTPVLTKLKGKNVQAVVNWSIEPAQSLVPKNMKQLGFDVPLYQSHGFGNIEYAKAAGKAAEGILFPCGVLLVADTLPDGHPQKALLMKYKTAYEGRFKEDISGFGGYAYDALLILSEAVKKAGSTDRSRVRAAIEGLKGFVGASGVFNFSPTDHNGLKMDSFEMLTVKDGRFRQAP